MKEKEIVENIDRIAENMGLVNFKDGATQAEILLKLCEINNVTETQLEIARYFISLISKYPAFEELLNDAFETFLFQAIKTNSHWKLAKGTLLHIMKDEEDDKFTIEILKNGVQIETHTFLVWWKK